MLCYQLRFDGALQRDLDVACLTQDRLALLGSFGMAQRPARFLPLPARAVIPRDDMCGHPFGQGLI